VGYCGLDRQRRPISGDEIRACWESRPEPVEAPLDTSHPTIVRTHVPRRDFIEVGPTSPATTEGQASAIVRAGPEPDLTMPVATPRWSLWEDVEA